MIPLHAEQNVVTSQRQIIIYAGARYYFIRDNSIAVYFCGKFASVNVRIKSFTRKRQKGCIVQSCWKRTLPTRAKVTAVDATRFHANRTEWYDNYRKMNTRCNSTCEIKINAPSRPETIVNHNIFRCTFVKVALFEKITNGASYF